MFTITLYVLIYLANIVLLSTASEYGRVTQYAYFKTELAATKCKHVVFASFNKT